MFLVAEAFMKTTLSKTEISAILSKLRRTGFCHGCGAELDGRQRLYCGPNCKMAVRRIVSAGIGLGHVETDGETVDVHLRRQHHDSNAYSVGHATGTGTAPVCAYEKCSLPAAMVDGTGPEHDTPARYRRFCSNRCIHKHYNHGKRKAMAG